MMHESTTCPKHIINVDTAFINFRDSFEKGDIENLFNDYVQSISKFININSENTDTDYLLSSDIGMEGKKFITVCLLRLLSIRGFSFDDFKITKHKVYTLFDEIMGITIYKYLKIDSKIQTFEKEIKLRDLTSSVEKKIKDEIESLNSLDSISLFRKRYTKLIKNKNYSFILNEFIGRNLISDARLNKIFSLTLSYIDKKQKKSIAIDKFNDAVTALKEYISDAKKIKTEYCYSFVLNVAEKILCLLNEDISKFDQYKPTTLNIEQIEKKYPLYEVDRKIFISVNIINPGPGYAFDVELIVSPIIDNIVINRPINNIGNMAPSTVNFDIPVTITTGESLAFVKIDITWKNFDNSTQNKTFELELEGQRSDIPWDEIRIEQPYSLEAVETEEELIGREEIIDKLLRQTLTKSIGSSYIFGQKRVGKTSIVKTLRSRISSNDYLVIFLESGDYICPSSEDTVKKLGIKICQQIKNFNEKFSTLKIPTFENGAFSSLIDFLDSVLILEPNIKILTILDEFDELPKDLYKRGPFGDAFFLTIRSISQKAPFGFILVGGEKIAYIMSCQGHALNKFRSMRVDYFDKENYLHDFSELIRRPVKKWFEISDTAINRLYHETSGNPFYTKWICSNMFDLMVNLRDCHVSSVEIDISTKKSLTEIASNGFQHFWDDGIFEDSGELYEEISIKRRKLLLAFASIVRSNNIPTKESLIENELLTIYGADINSEIEQFLRRQIFSERNGNLYLKIHFFEQWIINNGYNEILTTFVDKDAILKRNEKEEQSFIKSEEITIISESWPLYKGQKITDDKVRCWLNQFGSNANQRLMFKILQSINYYSSGRVREKLRQAHDIVRRGVTVYKLEKKKKLDEFLISYLDCPGKSGGGYYAKLYADENKIYYRNVIEKRLIGDVLKENKTAKALIFIDDFIGTGGTAKKCFSEIKSTFGDVIQKSSINLYFLAICGFEQRKDELDDFLRSIDLDVNTHICDPFDNTSKCFHENSSIFSSESEKEEAKLLAYEYGTKLCKKNFLGYGDCQTAVIFETNCPNNNLPILWEHSDKLPWTPLFPRK